MTFQLDEESVETGQPRELYTITQSSAVVYRLSSSEKDVDFDGNTYTAVPLMRSDIGVPTPSGESVLTLTIPLTHALCQRFMAMGVPPQRITVEVRRLQLNSGAAQRVWLGQIVSMDIAGHLGKFSIPSRLQRTAKRRLPLITVGVLCPHILYDRNCRVDPSSGFTKTTTVANVDGRTLKLATIAEFGDENWALAGEIIHDTTGERMTVIQESGEGFDGTTTFVIQIPIPEMRNGDTVTVRAGCGHTRQICLDKYNNVDNFGGIPDLPPQNIFLPNGPGIYHIIDL